MSYNFVLGDLVTQIRNAGMVRKENIIFQKYSNLCVSVLNILVTEGFISGFKVIKTANGLNSISIDLKYVGGFHSIRDISVVSTPGKRAYSNIEKLPYYRDGLGVFIISTNRGVITDKNARRLGIGGELLVKIF